jgi:hypothetical protein
MNDTQDLALPDPDLDACYYGERWTLPSRLAQAAFAPLPDDDPQWVRLQKLMG